MTKSSVPRHTQSTKKMPERLIAEAESRSKLSGFEAQENDCALGNLCGWSSGTAAASVLAVVVVSPSARASKRERKDYTRRKKGSSCVAAAAAAGLREREYWSHTLRATPSWPKPTRPLLTSLSLSSRRLLCAAYQFSWFFPSSSLLSRVCELDFSLYIVYARGAECFRYIYKNQTNAFISGKLKLRAINFVIHSSSKIN